MMCLVPSGGVFGSKAAPGVIRCPLRCKCDKASSNSTEWQVQCDDKTKWTKMPLLPINTVYLSINKSNIPILTNGVRRNLGGNSMQKLVLVKDNISSIVSNYFKELKQLEELILSKNSLQSLLNGTFEGIPNLRTLILDGNRFETLPSENICLLKKLQLLDLNLNKLPRIEFGDCFTDLKNLYSVDLSGNPIDKIEAGDLDGLRKSPVSILYLREMRLTQLSAKVFKYLRHLKVISIKNNKMKYLQSDLFKYVPGITSLSLKGNKLNRIPSVTIATLTSLEMLDVGRTNIRITALGSEFRRFVNLTRLDLGYNPLYKLYNNSFLSLSHSIKLTELNLISCKLKTIQAGAFLPLR